MSLPTSKVVLVNVIIGSAFPARTGFGILNLVTAETGVLNTAIRTAKYGSADGVAAHWPSDSEVVAAANTYFAQQPKPTAFTVSFRADLAQAAVLCSAPLADTPENVADFVAIADGSLEISIDGVLEDITALDFTTGVTELDNVAAVLQTALQAVASGGYTAATVVYNAAFQKFTVSSGTTGASSDIAFATTVDPLVGTDVSGLFGLRQGQAILSPGVDAETITASLDAIELFDPEWYGLAFTKEVRDNVMVNGEASTVAAANWVEARVKVFGNTSNDFGILNPAFTTDIASILADSGVGRTMTTYSSFVDQYPSVSALGKAFTVNFSQADSVITLAYKPLPTITVETIDVNQDSALTAKKANALVCIGGTPRFFEGIMADGKFFDTRHGTDWLADAAQNSVAGRIMTDPTRVPHNGPGYATLADSLTATLNEARTNGLIGPGTSDAGVFLPNGYQVNVTPESQVPPPDIASRDYNGLSAVVLGTGAIHGAQINITFEQ